MKWRKEFIDTKITNYYNATVDDSIQFMKQKKRNVDLEDKQHKKKDTDTKNKRPRDERRYNGGCGRGRG